MIEKGAKYVVMGLLDSDSIAYWTGKTIEDMGGKVIYTVQNERMKKIFFDRSKAFTPEERDRLDIRYCDITITDEIKALFAELGPIKGVVHSIAFANPQTCLGEEFHTDAVDDLKLGFYISAASLAPVTRYAQPNMKEGGAVVAMTFDSQRAYPYYNWMSVNKAALEATVRGLARRHGKDLVRVNAVSAGPLQTKAASKIPGFGGLTEMWNAVSPLPWDTEADKQEVANAVVYLLGQYSKKITGQVLYVDGGASICAGELRAFER